MKRELPKTYQNVISKKIDNSRTIYSTLGKEENNVKNYSSNVVKDLYTIEQKIYNIFSSPDYIYKADVTIITDNEVLKKRIIGKNKDNLITMDREYIPISTIRDIYK